MNFTEPKQYSLQPTFATTRGVAKDTIFNSLIRKYNYKSYLEVGVFDPKGCFNKVEAETKVGLEPNPYFNGVKFDLPEGILEIPSDIFFERNEDQTFDLIFIDGLHADYQVLKDIDNALHILNPGGTIVTHDNMPSVHVETLPEPRWDVCGSWMGTTWKAFAHMRMTRPELSMLTIDADCGLGVIRPGSQECYPKHPWSDLEWPFYTEHRQELMNIITVEEFIEREEIDLVVE